MGPLSKRFETKVAMKLVDQNNKVYKSNYNQNLGGVYSISMVIPQPKLIANNRIVIY